MSLKIKGSLSEKIETKFFIKRDVLYMYPDFFSATFFGLRKDYSKEYKLTKEDQSDYFFESMFILMIQIILCICIWHTPEFYNGKLLYCNNYVLNLCMFTCVLILHFGSVMTIRNGMNMCMYVTYHSDKFEKPRVAFLLGFMTIFANVFASITNLVMALTQKDVISVIHKFIGFRILLQI